MASRRGEFSFDALLGRGSFGEVYRVTRSCSNATYVIKTIGITALGAKEQQDAIREVHLLSSIEHPRIVSYLDSFVEAGKLHIVMEHCEGGDLHGLLATRSGALLPEAQAWCYFLQTLHGLSHLHSLKVRHFLPKSPSHRFQISRLGAGSPPRPEESQPFPIEPRPQDRRPRRLAPPRRVD